MQGYVLSTGSYAAYQWSLNNNPIAGATNQSYTATQNGYYTVTVTDTNGCSATSADSVIISGLDVSNIESNKDEVKIYPNPASSVLNIESNAAISISMISMDGKLLIREDHAGTINISKLPRGIYIVKVFDEKGILIKVEKMLKE
jgi:hypothetical protein